MVGFLYYNKSPYHWIINDLNHGNERMAEGVITLTDGFQQQNGKSPVPEGGVPSVCYGDHEEL